MSKAEFQVLRKFGNPGDARIESVLIRHRQWILAALDELAATPPPQYNISPGRGPAYASHADRETQICPYTWGYRTPNGAAAKRKL